MTIKNKLSRLPFECPLDASPYSGIIYNKDSDKEEVWFIADIKGYETETIARTKMVFEIRNSNGDIKTFTHQIDKANPSKPNDVDTVRKKLASGSLLHPNNYHFAPSEVLKGLRNEFNKLPYDLNVEAHYEDEETEVEA
tara:strand:- start:66 stop:482 length:417 start_codon:yes stop_codon:yes gene_type:complete